MHGGTNAGAPPGNKRALRTGEHETIYADCLDPHELVLFDSISADPHQQLDEQIRLSAIRIRRMMCRITDLERHAHTAGGVGPATAAGHRLGQIQNIEEGLTRVVGRHTQLLTLKHQVESAQPPEEDADVSGYVDALERKAEDLPWPEQA